MVGLVDIADRHGRARRPRCGCGRRTASGTCGRRPACSALVWPAETSIRSAPASAKARPISTASVGRDAVVARPVVRRDAHRHRPVFGPRRAHRAEDFERKAQAVLEAAAIFVGAPVLQRGDEARTADSRARHAARPCRSRLRSATLGRGDELVAHPVHVGARHRRGHLVVGGPRRRRDGAISGQLPSSSGTSIPSQPTRVEPFAPLWPSCRQIFALEWPWTKSTMRFHAGDLRVVPHAGAARRDPAFRRDAGHLGDRPARRRPARARRNGRDGSRSARRRPPNTSPSARRRRGSRAPSRAA